MVVHDLISWTELTLGGIPPLKVALRPLTMLGRTFAVGELFDPNVLPPLIRKERLRQFYEQRRLEPVNAPANTRQFYRDRIWSVAHPEDMPVQPLVEPLQPVAANIVADLGVPSLDIPVAESDALDAPDSQDRRKPPPRRR